MPVLTTSEKAFLCAGLILQINDSPEELALVWHGLAAEIADKLGCTPELRKAAENFKAWEAALKGGNLRVCK